MPLPERERIYNGLRILNNIYGRGYLNPDTLRVGERGGTIKRKVNIGEHGGPFHQTVKFRLELYRNARPDSNMRRLVFCRHSIAV